jgi:hypothetical protein
MSGRGQIWIIEKNKASNDRPPLRDDKKVKMCKLHIKMKKGKVFSLLLK